MISAHEVGARGLVDEDQLDRATELGRAILSWNYNDFIRISKQRAAPNVPHGGIVVSYHHYRADEISAAVEIISNFMNHDGGERLPNCFYRLEDFR